MTSVSEPPDAFSAADGLRAAGLRVTPQRELVMNTLAAKPGQHVTAEEVWQVVQERYTAINRSTVYRILELLTRHGLVTSTRLGSSIAHYELAHDHAHHHLVCVRCRRVVQLPASDVSTLRKRIFERHGFRLGAGDLTLEGLCVDCAAAGEGRRV